MKRCYSKASLIWQIFLNSMLISTFTVGGGYVIISVMRSRYVEKLGWLDEKQMTDFVTLAQSSPGAMAVNTSLLVGDFLAGKAGAAAAVCGTVIPPFLAMCCISYFYREFISNRAVSAIMRGMQLGVAAVIIDIALTYVKKSFDAGNIAVAVTLISLVLLMIFNVNILCLIAAGAVVGAITALISHKKTKGDESGK